MFLSLQAAVLAAAAFCYVSALSCYDNSRTAEAIVIDHCSMCSKFINKTRTTTTTSLACYKTGSRSCIGTNAISASTDGSLFQKSCACCENNCNDDRNCEPTVDPIYQNWVATYRDKQVTLPESVEVAQISCYHGGHARNTTVGAALIKANCSRCMKSVTKQIVPNGRVVFSETYLVCETGSGFCVGTLGITTYTNGLYFGATCTCCSSSCNNDEFCNFSDEGSITSTAGYTTTTTTAELASEFTTTSSSSAEISTLIFNIVDPLVVVDEENVTDSADDLEEQMAILKNVVGTNSISMFSTIIISCMLIPPLILF